VAVNDTHVFVTPYLKVPDIMVASFNQRMAHLVDEASRLRPPRFGEFAQQAAAIHEAAHCVIAAREGLTMRYVQIARLDGEWIGENMCESGGYDIDPESELFLAHMRMALAGRRGELLFCKNFCLRAGIDELAYVQTMLLLPLMYKFGCDAALQHYEAFWLAILAEIDASLLKYKTVVHDLADKLMQHGKVRSRKLARALSIVAKRDGPPPFRTLTELHSVVPDPLAVENCLGGGK
jgi:hypothetical protein